MLNIEYMIFALRSAPLTDRPTGCISEVLVEVIHLSHLMHCNAVMKVTIIKGTKNIISTTIRISATNYNDKEEHNSKQKVKYNK